MTAADPAGLPHLPARSRLTIPSIDGFRGLAAVTVVLYHCFLGAGQPQLDEGPVRAVLAAGYMGVDFFFVISGFVLFLPAVLNAGDIGHRRSYLLRRIARIGPGYYLFLFVALALTPVFVDDAIPLPHEGSDGVMLFLSHLTFLQHHVGRLFGEPYALLALSWTLTLEALFYVLLPYIARSFHRHPVRWLGGALAVSIAWRYAVTHAADTLGWLGAGGWDPTRLARAQLFLVTQFPSYLAHFALGMVAAWGFVRLRNRARQVPAAVVVAVQVASLVAVLLAMRIEGIRALTEVGYGPWTRTTHVAVLFAALLVATALAPARFQWPVANPVSRWVGDVSYGTYLAHLMLVVVAIITLDFEPANSWTAFLRMVAFVVPASLLAAWISFVLVERPARLWAARKSRAWAGDDTRREEATSPPESREAGGGRGAPAGDAMANQ